MTPVETSLARSGAVPVPVPAPVPARTSRADVAATMVDLHTHHGDELLRFCRWMLKDAEDSADALQDTWIRAMSALGERNIRVAALRPWLYAIARNVCLDRLRDRKRASLHALDEELAGETPGADEVVALRDEAGAALALVGALSERQRSALLMRELAGMSVPEIATALGLTPERAAWAIGDARRALEEARAGTSMACEDARARLASGRRGRTLRSHLGECGACCAHDRRLRARRLLAPALAPFLWLRDLSLPFLANPAAAAAVTVTLAATAAAPLSGDPRPADRPDAVPAAVSAAADRSEPEGRAGAIARNRRVRDALPARGDRPAPHAAVTPSAGVARRSAVPPAAPAAEPPATGPVPAPAPARGPAHRIPAAAPELVGRGVDAAVESLAPVGALVEDAAATATGVLDRLG